MDKVLAAILSAALLAGCSANPPTLAPTTAPTVAPAAVPTPSVAASSTTPSGTLASAGTPAAAVLTSGLPDPALTPGAPNPAVTETTIGQTICVSGWTATVRPPTSYTDRLKAEQLALYGFSDRDLADYEEDHLVSLEVGGSPQDPKNLWPEPHHIVVGGLDLGSYTKDTVENVLKTQVCDGKLTLAQAQSDEATDWVAYWREKVQK